MKLLRSVLFFILTFSAQLALAQGKRTYAVIENFSRVSVFGPFKITLVPSDKNYLQLDYGSVDPDDVIAEADEDVMILKLRNRKYLNDWKENRSTDYVQVMLHYKSLDEITAKAGAKVQNDEPLVSRNLLIESDMGAEVNLKVKAKNLYVKCNMGSDNRLSGKTEMLEVKANMGALLNARDLSAEHCYVKAGMGADVKVHVTVELKVNASMGAIVRYYGNPTVIDSTTTLGGEVTSRNQ